MAYENIVYEVKAGVATIPHPQGPLQPLSKYDARKKNWVFSKVFIAYISPLTHTSRGFFYYAWSL